MHRPIAHRYTQGLSNPALHCAIGGEALRSCQGRLQLRHLARVERWRFARRGANRQQRCQAALLIQIQPARHAVTAHPQHGSDLLALRGLPTRQQVQRVQTLLFESVPLLLLPLAQLRR